MDKRTEQKIVQNRWGHRISQHFLGVW